MRTEKGAERIADLRSYLQTTAKHGIQALAALTQLTSPNPWLSGYPDQLRLTNLPVDPVCHSAERHW